MKFWIPLAGIAIVALGAYLLWPSKSPYVMRTISVDNIYFQVEVADTEPLREQGLGSRGSLKAGHGMLFVFDTPASWGIWMKDMRFPIDILWAREDGTVITVVHNVSPDTYPLALYPQTPDAKYVLEVPSGAAKEIREGSRMVINEE